MEQAASGVTELVGSWPLVLQILWPETLWHLLPCQKTLKKMHVFQLCNLSTNNDLICISSKALYSYFAEKTLDRGTVYVGTNRLKTSFALDCSSPLHDRVPRIHTLWHQLYYFKVYYVGNCIEDNWLGLGDTTPVCSLPNPRHNEIVLGI